MIQRRYQNEFQPYTILLPHVVHYEIEHDAHTRVIEHHHGEQDGEVQRNVQRCLSPFAGNAVTGFAEGMDEGEAGGFGVDWRWQRKAVDVQGLGGGGCGCTLAT